MGLNGAVELEASFATGYLQPLLRLQERWAWHHCENEVSKWWGMELGSWERGLPGFERRERLRLVMREWEGTDRE
jgi:hypothetical protein